MNAPYRTRFAPSPTGRLHPGHARTLLATWLRARSLGGTIVLRMEDIDRPRVVVGAAEAICRDLDWLGLHWDEGPVFQSDRGELYEAALEKLTAAGLTYPCTCSRREIAEAASAPHGDDGLRYPGTCRNGPPSDRATVRPPATRFLLEGASRDFDDRIAGAVEATDPGGDFVLRRGDGIWAYQLAVVVDDGEQRISEVIRGADLLSSTPRQLALYEALELEPPAFAHVPLVVDADGTRLSKRHETSTIASLRDAGWSAESVIGRLAQSLALVADDAPIRAEELVSGFDWNRIPRSCVVWNARG